MSDYLGVLFRRGKVSRVPAERDGTNRARWKYVWRNKEAPVWRKPPSDVVDFKPKALLDRPNIYIAEDGGHIHIQMPHLSITIKAT